MGFDLSLNFLNRNKSTDKPTESIGEWKDPQTTHHASDNEDLSIATNFICMYCLNIDGYIHFLNTSIEAGSITPHNIDVTPYSPDWSSFKRHMYASHPEQWCYGEVPNDYFKITKSTTSWNKTDKADVADAYIQIRAKQEYGWNFFAVVNDKIQHTLHALPKDEETITRIEWYPRINPLTDKPWTDWRFEKEGETHKRAQNVLPRIVGRTHASITPVLRGMRMNHSSDGHVLERNPKRLAKYAHLPPYVNATCIFTEDALKRVQDLRDICNLKGPGNIGILRMQTGHHVHTESKVQNKETKKGEKVVKESIPETQSNINRPSINAQDVSTQLEHLLPKNDFTNDLMGQVSIIFNYAREQSQHEEDFYKVQSELDAANDLIKGLRRDVAEATADTKKVEEERDAAKKQITTLQDKLNARGRNKSAAEVKSDMDEVTKKTLNKIRNGPRII
ncbi:hypothetical protein CMI37_06870 [Candidatus Pacearchaeota archaeon]|nr:hypothetical protein [Candidatus Pacearchaeota archaeon]